ncbi:hypothetical protein NQ318_003324 [Aromia moschata]|uniref:Uncharacterized protein n=1 Tax=Aromia moschata TaxID=1265417 RepID=A0AAV8YNN5_9CUCU|nr:hypothetical protein NQ318_003324 [Aromia moschata]
MYPEIDLLILAATQTDTLDIELNQANLSVYPTNDFLASLISDSCDVDSLGLFDETIVHILDTIFKVIR